MTTTLSVSRMDTLHACLRLYRYKYVQGLQPRDVPMNLRLGSLLHEVLAEFYRMGFEYQPAIEKWYREAIDGLSHGSYTEDEVNFGVQLATRLGDSYPRKWGSDLDRYRFIAVEKEFRIPGIKRTTRGIRHDRTWEFHGFFDAVARDRQTNDLVVFEHKSTKSTSVESAMAFYDPSPQSIAYLAAARVMFLRPDGRWPDGTTCPGVKLIFNFVRKAIPKVPDVTKSGQVSKAWIDTTEDIYLDAVRRAGGNVADYGDIVARLQLQGDRYLFRCERYPEPFSNEVFWSEAADSMKRIRQAASHDFYPRSFSSCNNRYGKPCQFAKVCLGQNGPVDDPMMINAFFEAKHNSRETPAEEEET